MKNVKQIALTIAIVIGLIGVTFLVGAAANLPENNAQACGFDGC